MASETAEHIVVAQWLERRPGILWCHPPNGGYRHAPVARLMKRLGCSPGVPDLLIWTAPPAGQGPDACPEFAGRTGMAIEMKRAVGRSYLRPEQKVWIRRLGESGWYATSCKGAREAISLLERAGYGSLAVAQPTPPAGTGPGPTMLRAATASALALQRIVDSPLV